MNNLPDQELLSKVRDWNSKLCSSGGKAWSLTIPANPNNDPDLLIEELCKRFEKKSNSSNINNVKDFILQFKKENLPDAETPFHYEAEIWSGMKQFIQFLEEKEKNNK